VSFVSSPATSHNRIAGRMRQACLWITQQDGIHALSSQEGIDIMALRRDVHQHRPDRAERNRD